MGFLSQIFGRDKALSRDARRIYDSLMQQSRQAEFYGTKRVTDNYDGRIDLLTLHMAIMLKALNAYGEQGAALRQALFDQMKDDFEIALREEGISDTGVKKRIKPMISLFYDRVKTYTGALIGDAPKAKMAEKLAEFHEGVSDKYLKALSAYSLQFSKTLDGKTLGELALTDFTYPTFNPKV